MGLAAFNKIRREQAEKLKAKEENTETEEEKRARLIARATELEIKGVLASFKTETLEKKIAETEENIKAGE